MRVGVVTDFYYPWIGGPSAAVRNLSNGLADRGHDVFLLAPSPDGAVCEQHEGPVCVTRVRTVPVPVGYRLRTAVPPIGIASWLRRTRPDVIHIHHPFPLSAAALAIARGHRVPVAATNHTIPECSLWGLRGSRLFPAARLALGRWIVNVLSRCDRVATPTETAAQLLRQLGFHRNIHVISNGVDVDRFKPGPPLRELGRRLGLDSRPVMLYTGRLDAEKEMDVWLRAAAEIARRRDVQFVVGGEGTDRPRLEALAVDLGLEGHARFVGYLDESEYPALYRLADVYCITSPVELQSITTLEAVASGLPVVAVGAGALPELVRNGENGYLVQQGNWAGVADAADCILGEADKRAAMRQASRSVALDHALQRSIELYEGFLEAAARRGDNSIERIPAAR